MIGKGNELIYLCFYNGDVSTKAKCSPEKGCPDRQLFLVRHRRKGRVVQGMEKGCRVQGIGSHCPMNKLEHGLRLQGI